MIVICVFSVKVEIGRSAETEPTGQMRVYESSYANTTTTPSRVIVTITSRQSQALWLRDRSAEAPGLQPSLFFRPPARLRGFV